MNENFQNNQIAQEQEQKIATWPLIFVAFGTILQLWVLFSVISTVSGLYSQLAFVFADGFGMIFAWLFLLIIGWILAIIFLRISYYKKYIKAYTIIMISVTAIGFIVVYLFAINVFKLYSY